ncbi:hypothetical protein GALL_346030 [mine drainage metagenome]|uniref:Uncharacterized protein n=1 Tax=mine drainage metagenome TaxID=410659 RepID=A0A1J5QUN7_9ZZZZ
MNCPFCDEEIKDKALVCKHCGRDLSLLRPVLDRFTQMEARLESLEAAMHRVGSHVDAARTARPLQMGAAPLPLGMPGARDILLPLLAVLLLYLSHLLIIGIWDLNPWWLRVLSVLLPLPFGWYHARSIRATLVAALVIAALSIYGMLVTTSLLDHVPILPQTRGDWLEVAEFAASIGLSYLTGSQLGGWLRRRRGPDEDSLAFELASLLARHSAAKGETAGGMRLRIESLANYINIITVLITAAGTLITGIVKFLPGIGS